MSILTILLIIGIAAVILTYFSIFLSKESIKAYQDLVSITMIQEDELVQK